EEKLRATIHLACCVSCRQWSKRPTSAASLTVDRGARYARDGATGRGNICLDGPAPGAGRGRRGHLPRSTRPDARLRVDQRRGRDLTSHLYPPVPNTFDHQDAGRHRRDASGGRGNTRAGYSSLDVSPMVAPEPARIGEPDSAPALAQPYLRS